MNIDLNCDLGEGSALDAEIIPLVSTINVACGFHAGDPETAWAALSAAAKLGVQVGAHPSFPDREHFGRHELKRSEPEIYHDCVYQIGALHGMTLAAGITLSHVKPHGALYNLACREDAYARPVVDAAALFHLPVMGLPDSRMQELSTNRCAFIPEAFADRRYREDGSLVPRNQPDAMIEDPREAVQQVERLVRSQRIRTICVHGDNQQALDFLRALRSHLSERGYTIAGFSP